MWGSSEPHIVVAGGVLLTPYGAELGSLAHCAAEHLGEVTGKSLVRAGRVPSHVLDVGRREVAVAP